MLEFIPAEKLKISFSVFGHFYSISLDSGEHIDCRSVLEIVAKEAMPQEIDSLLDQLPDAVFIMMNPGSSEPLEKVDNIIMGDNISQLNISLVPTKPDITQYQVMRVMHFKGWNHVRVINISDLRDSESGSFTKRYRELENQTGFTAHSIFADERHEELNDKLKRKEGAPVVCAWGVSTDLDPLITRCLEKIDDLSSPVGLLKQDTINKYFHPLPNLQEDRKEWVNDMVAKLSA